MRQSVHHAKDTTNKKTQATALI